MYLFPCPSSSSSLWLLCVTWQWKQYKLEVLFHGLRDIHERYTAMCACVHCTCTHIVMHLYIKKNVVIHVISIRVCQIWAGTTGWSILPALPSFSVHSATPKWALCNVHHPTPMSRMPTHRYNSLRYVTGGLCICTPQLSNIVLIYFSELHLHTFMALCKL